LREELPQFRTKIIIISINLFRYQSILAKLQK
jgi:hypothetical protein